MVDDSNRKHRKWVTTMSEDRETASTPEDLTRLFVERANAGDAAGMALLYEPEAVLAFPPGSETVGRSAIESVCEKLIAARPTFPFEEPLPTVRAGDLALTSTASSDNTGGRVQVVRRQSDGTWLRLIDRPESK